jgi:ABC-type branched-subunit amino acid transport system ATPase component/branched-subunit amino acid ABC-type transport system permease component
MNGFLTFLFLGLGVGAIYALLAQGIVLIHRGSQVVNFSQGAVALVGASVFAGLRSSLPSWLAAAIGIVICAALGLVLHLIMQRLAGASELARVVATLGVMSVLEGGVSLVYGSQLRFASPILPSGAWHFAGAQLPWDRAGLVLIAAVITVVLWLVYSRTQFGLRTLAVSENRRSLGALGWNTGAISAANWVIGSVLAAGAGILVAPVTGVEPSAMMLLVIPALAAGAIGSFNSFPLALTGGLAIGALQSEATRISQVSGLDDAIPFLVVLIVVLIKKDVLGSRLSGSLRLPRLGDGRLRPFSLIICTTLAIGSLWFFSASWDSSVSLTMASAVIAISLVVLTGYTRQLSLGQYAMAGLGAWIATRLAALYGWPFLLVLIIGIVAVVPAGMLFALPALRARGVILAVVTLGLGIALQSLIFNNPSLTGGPITGTVVKAPDLFGLNISPITHPQRYAVVTIVAFIAVGLIVRNIRRSGSGRRLLAVRTNERAAAALGISVTGAKVYAFAVATAIAAIGGIILAFSNTQITFDSFTPLQSILLVLSIFIGGIGFVVSAIVAGTFVVGSVVYELLGNFFNVGGWVTFIGGILAIVTILQAPDGVIGQYARMRARLTQAVHARLGRPARPPGPLAHCQISAGTLRPPPTTLSASGLSVRFGGVTALAGVDIAVSSGEVVGLIGPNGAGKSTLVDAVVGLNRRYQGTVAVNGRRLDRQPSYKRSRAGIARSFQSLELFDDLTVLENILAACDERRVRSYLTDLVLPRRPHLTASAMAAIEVFELTDMLGKRPEELSYGTRRLVAVARALASAPRILLLDEPAAGLDETQSRHLGKLIRRMADEWSIGVLLIEHDVALVMSVCDRISVLNFGRCIATGTPDQIRNDPSVIEAYIGTGTAEDAPSPYKPPEGIPS